MRGIPSDTNSRRSYFDFCKSGIRKKKKFEYSHSRYLFKIQQRAVIYPRPFLAAVCPKESDNYDIKYILQQSNNSSRQPATLTAPNRLLSQVREEEVLDSFSSQINQRGSSTKCWPFTAWTNNTSMDKSSFFSSSIKMMTFYRMAFYPQFPAIYAYAPVPFPPQPNQVINYPRI